MYKFFKKKYTFKFFNKKFLKILYRFNFTILYKSSREFTLKSFREFTLTNLFCFLIFLKNFFLVFFLVSLTFLSFLELCLIFFYSSFFNMTTNSNTINNLKRGGRPFSDIWVYC